MTAPGHRLLQRERTGSTDPLGHFVGETDCSQAVVVEHLSPSDMLFPASPYTWHAGFRRRGPELQEGGAAVAVYGRLQLEEVDPIEREAIQRAPLRYCKLVTLAMVMTCRLGVVGSIVCQMSAVLAGNGAHAAINIVRGWTSTYPWLSAYRHGLF